MRKILFITHQLSLSGAPIVLLDMIRTVMDEGYGAVVISLTDGPLSQELDRMGISWRVQADFLKDWKSFYLELQGFSAVVVNTLVAYPPVFLLKHTNIPVIWWLHETEWYFETYDKMKDITPGLAELTPNIKLVSVSPAVQEIIKSRYGIETEVLPFCVQDQPVLPQNRHDRVRFLTLASFASVKGQDILAEAIRLLPEDILKRCEFLMYGGVIGNEADFMTNVERTLADLDNANVFPAVDHDEAMAILADCDYCLIPSREEPFSAVAVEGMVRHKPSVLTDVCGVTAYLTDGKDALFCRADDAQALSNRIRDAAEIYLFRPREYDKLGDNVRTVYDMEFSPEVYRKRIHELLGKLTETEE